MAFMAAAAPYIAAASMAATAAGSAASMMAQKKRMNAIDKLRKRTSAGIEANRQQAEAAWKEALAKAAPEQQERMIKEQGGRSLDLYKAVVGDEALPGGGIIKMGEGAPKIV